MPIHPRWRNAGAALLSGRRTTFLLAAGIASLLIGFRHFPVASLAPGCPLYEWTGLYCPGCGATRALDLLAHGDVAGAVAMNTLLPGWIALAVLLSCSSSTFIRIAQSRAFAWLAVAVVLTFTIARNLPWEPFRLLAPGAMFAR